MDDLVLLAFDRRSGWQQRVRLLPVRTQPGRYRARLPEPPARDFDLLVSSASLDLDYAAGRLGTHALDEAVRR